MTRDTGSGAFARAAVATAAYGIVHSLLASAGAKRKAARWLGERHRAGLYRAFFNTQSVLTFAGLVAYVIALPRREAWRVEGPAAGAMRAGQAAALLWAFWAARTVGIGPITGWSSFRDWIRGASPLPEPEAQGPPPDDDGSMHVRGPFRFSRHPLNLAPLGVLWLQPTVTTRWLGVATVSTVYLVLGSAHEERRLEDAYGEPYRRYREGGTSFYLPAPARHDTVEMTAPTA